MSDIEGDVPLADRIKRNASPIRRSFVERLDGDDRATPLAQLLRTQGATGGKGGALRITLLLSLIWVCAREPFSTRRVAAYWADLLGRDDPRGEGARAIRDCLHELEDRGVIALNASSSSVEITLLDEVAWAYGPTEPTSYVLPYGEPYIPVPRTLWSTGVVGRLSGAGVAMYLCALALTRHDDAEFFVSAAFFESRFGISRSSRKRGLAELVAEGVLDVRVEESIDLDTFRKRRRNLYTVNAGFRQPAPWAPNGVADGDRATEAPAQDQTSTAE